MWDVPGKGGFVAVLCCVCRFSGPVQDRRRATVTEDTEEQNLWKWQTESARWRSELGVTRDYAPYTKRWASSFKGLPKSVLGGPTKRVLDLIDCSVLEVCKRARKTMPQCADELNETVIDVSQSHGRRPFSTSGVARTLTTSSRLFVLSQRRLLLPREHLMLQGFLESVEIPASVSDTAIRHMAGEGMALPCLATILMALLLTKEIQ